MEHAGIKKRKQPGVSSETLPLFSNCLALYLVNHAFVTGAELEINHSRSLLSRRYRCRKLKYCMIRKPFRKTLRTSRTVLRNAAETVKKSRSRLRRPTVKRKTEDSSTTTRSATESAPCIMPRTSIQAEERAGERYANEDSPPAVPHTATSAPETRLATHLNVPVPSPIDQTTILPIISSCPWLPERRFPSSEGLRLRQACRSAAAWS